MGFRPWVHRVQGSRRAEDLELVSRDSVPLLQQTLSPFGIDEHNH